MKNKKTIIAGILIGVIILLASSLIRPFMSRPHIHTPSMECQASLKGIGIATAIYMNEHNGDAPDSIDQLLEADLTERDFSCPNCEKLYTWCGKGLTDQHPGNMILAFCDNHIDENGFNLVWLDGYVEKLTTEEFIMKIEDNNRLRKQYGLKLIIEPELNEE